METQSASGSYTWLPHASLHRGSQEAVHQLGKWLLIVICPLGFAEMGHTDLPDFLLCQSKGFLVSTWTMAWEAVEEEGVCLGHCLQGRGCRERLFTAFSTLSS